MPRARATSVLDNQLNNHPKYGPLWSFEILCYQNKRSNGFNRGSIIYIGSIPLPATVDDDDSVAGLFQKMTGLFLFTDRFRGTATLMETNKYVQSLVTTYTHSPHIPPTAPWPSQRLRRRPTRVRTGRACVSVRWDVFGSVPGGSNHPEAEEVRLEP